MTEHSDALPRCGMPVSRLSRGGRITKAACRAIVRRGERRCWKHLDLFAWAASERKVRERRRVKLRARYRGWSVEKLAALREDRQLDLFAWGDAYQHAIRRAVDAHIGAFTERPAIPDADAPRSAWDRWYAAADAHEREQARRAENLNHLIATAGAAAERAMLEAQWPAWGTLRWLVYERDGGICFVCDRTVPFEYFELGHLQDRMMGGSDRPDNVVVMCYRCNHLHKPLHETAEDAREWAAACRAQFRRIAAAPAMSDEAFQAHWSGLSESERERLVDDALGWPDQVEAARLELRAALAVVPDSSSLPESLG